MEKWKDVIGYENDYEISTYGRVRSKDRIISYANGSKRLQNGRILKQYKNTSGYMYVHLSRKKKRELKFIHRMIAESFIDNPKGKSEVNHKDNDKLNNYVDNLEWVTRSENMEHYWKTTDTEELRKRLSENLKKNKIRAKRIIILDIINRTFYYFNSGKEASVYFGHCPSYFSGLIASNNGKSQKYIAFYL